LHLRCSALEGLSDSTSYGLQALFYGAAVLRSWLALYKPYLQSLLGLKWHVSLGAAAGQATEASKGLYRDAIRQRASDERADQRSLQGGGGCRCLWAGVRPRHLHVVIEQTPSSGQKGWTHSPERTCSSQRGQRLIELTWRLKGRPATQPPRADWIQSTSAANNSRHIC
jgi:hypothetical protein